MTKTALRKVAFADDKPTNDVDDTPTQSEPGIQNNDHPTQSGQDNVAKKIHDASQQGSHSEPPLNEPSAANNANDETGSNVEIKNEHVTNFQLSFLKRDELLLVPLTRPMSLSRLIEEVKAIYAGLVMVERKCIEIDALQEKSIKHIQQAVEAAIDTEQLDRPLDVAKAGLSDEQYQALIELHRVLLHEHHDFFLASQHPSASKELNKLAEKNTMPSRIWFHGIHAMLELLRHRLPKSEEHMKAFINLAYSTSVLLYESVPRFYCTWTEVLGDVARYGFASETDQLGRELWRKASDRWYQLISDKKAWEGRPYHHRGILENGIFGKLCYFVMSITAPKSYQPGRERILEIAHDLFPSRGEKEHKGKYCSRISPDERRVVNAYVLLFMASQSAEDLDKKGLKKSPNEYLAEFDSAIQDLPLLNLKFGISREQQYILERQRSAEKKGSKEGSEADQAEKAAKHSSEDLESETECQEPPANNMFSAENDETETDAADTTAAVADRSEDKYWEEQTILDAANLATEAPSGEEEQGRNTQEPVNEGCEGRFGYELAILLCAALAGFPCSPERNPVWATFFPEFCTEAKQDHRPDEKDAAIGDERAWELFKRARRLTWTVCTQIFDGVDLSKAHADLSDTEFYRFFHCILVFMRHVAHKPGILPHFEDTFPVLPMMQILNHLLQGYDNARGRNWERIQGDGFPGTYASLEPHGLQEKVDLFWQALKQSGIERQPEEYSHPIPEHWPLRGCPWGQPANEFLEAAKKEKREKAALAEYWRKHEREAEKKANKANSATGETKEVAGEVKGQTAEVEGQTAAVKEEAGKACEANPRSVSDCDAQASTKGAGEQGSKEQDSKEQDSKEQDSKEQGAENGGAENHETEKKDAQKDELWLGDLKNNSSDELWLGDLRNDSSDDSVNDPNVLFPKDWFEKSDLDPEDRKCETPETVKDRIVLILWCAIQTASCGAFFKYCRKTCRFLPLNAEEEKDAEGGEDKAEEVKQSDNDANTSVSHDPSMVIVTYEASETGLTAHSWNGRASEYENSGGRAKDNTPANNDWLVVDYLNSMPEWRVPG